MVKHIILWNIKAEYSDKEKIKLDIKDNLERLKGEIPGLINIKVYISGLESSTADVMLDSSFEDEQALKAYAVNEKHVYVANTFVRPFTEKRSCLDFEI